MSPVSHILLGTTYNVSLNWESGIVQTIALDIATGGGHTALAIALSVSGNSHRLDASHA